MTEKRNSTHGIAQHDLFASTPGAGVGARPGGAPVASGGGGYLENCASENFQDPIADPRFAELRRIGLPRMWLIVAETIGFDAFLDVWRRLTEAGDTSGYGRETGGLKMPSLRSYDAYLRYQRNRYIEALAARGMTPAQVQRAVSRNLREPLDEKHVFKIMRKR